MLPYVFLLIGLVLLTVGGDILVRGAVGLAERISVPPLVIGLTIVAFGTSAPELVVSLKAAFSGSPGIAIGNVVGSNIANVLLVLSLPALIAKMRYKEEGVGRNLLVLIGITIVFMGMLANGDLKRLDGMILLALLALFIYDQYRTAQDHRRANEPVHDYHEDVENIPHSAGMIAVLLVGGLIALPVGADLTVRGASEIARSLGVSEEVIGLTIVAIGTSLPEVATSLLAVWRNNGSVALGNVVGSNVFNIAAIMGVTSTLVPLAVADRIIYLDMWVMLACALLIGALAHWNVGVGKRAGVAMFASYAIYIGISFAQ